MRAGLHCCMVDDGHAGYATQHALNTKGADLGVSTLQGPVLFMTCWLQEGVLN